MWFDTNILLHIKLDHLSSNVLVGESPICLLGVSYILECQETSFLDEFFRKFFIDNAKKHAFKKE